MPIDFQEFLRQKTLNSDVRERNRTRADWIRSLNSLHEQIQNWLREADPEGLIEVIPYQIRRAESRLGFYDAPALKIRLNTDEVDVLPIGRYSFGPLSMETRKGLSGVIGTDGPAAGRVDITDGERRIKLFRDTKSDLELWYAIDERSGASPFDIARLEAILQDLWS